MKSTTGIHSLKRKHRSAHPHIMMNRVVVILFGIVVSGVVVVVVAHRRKRRTKKNGRSSSSLLELVGNTPLVLVPSLSKETGCEIYAKCEWMNPCGSSKDRIAKEILMDAMESKRITPGGTVVEASSGSTGISLTRMARSIGLSTLIVIPNDQAQEKIHLLRRLGAAVELVKPASIVHPEHNVNVAKRRAAELSNSIFADQFENDANVRAHLKTGQEIWEQTERRIDAFVMSAGTSGTLAGVSQYLKSKNPKVRVVLADPQGSSLFHAVKHGVLYAPEQSEKTIRRHRIDTIVEGVGLDRMTKNFKTAQPLIDEAFRVSDPEVVTMARRLLLEDGFFVGSSSALNSVAALKLAKVMGPGHVIVTVFCSSGERELTKVHDDEFCRMQGLL